MTFSNDHLVQILKKLVLPSPIGSFLCQEHTSAIDLYSREEFATAADSFGPAVAGDPPADTTILGPESSGLDGGQHPEFLSGKVFKVCVPNHLKYRGQVRRQLRVNEVRVVGPKVTLVSPPGPPGVAYLPESIFVVPSDDANAVAT